MTRSAICLGIACALFASRAGAAEEKAKASKGAGKPAPTASSKELDKIKGEYKWGMTSEEVVGKVQDFVRSTFDERLKKTIHDPTKQDRVRKEMAAEVEKVKGKVIKFDGQKTGYDVSIVDQEFLHNTGESMLVIKEENATRYFFFADDRLYKMFLAFDKEMLQGKAFREFGQLMQARFGKAREVNVEERTKTGVKVKLDHFVWGSKSGDMLRLVDRSEFYDVFCLVIYDGKVAERQEQVRKSRATGPKRDNLVEAVTTQPANDRDPHDNVLDQITGKEVLKPGERKAADIVVPSPAEQGVKAPTPSEVNRPDPKEARGNDEKKKKATKADETKGLQL